MKFMRYRKKKKGRCSNKQSRWRCYWIQLNTFLCFPKWKEKCYTQMMGHTRISIKSNTNWKQS